MKRISTRSVIRRNSARRGFTLVEVLLALALAGVLMAGVFTALEIYRQLSTSGRDDVERTQIVRAIQRKITVDIRSIVFTPPAEEESGGGGEGQAADEVDPEADMIAEVEVIDPANAITGTAKGVMGDVDAVVLHISRPPWRMEYTEPQDGGGRSLTGQSSDLISVTYLYASPDGNSELSKAVAAFTGKSGLARLQGDRLAMDTADQAGDVEQLAQTAVILSEDVVGVKFEYLDGQLDTEPLTAWNSKETKKLPRAIRVTLAMRVKTVDGTTNPDAKTINHTFVVAVPIADPKPPELEQSGF